MSYCTIINYDSHITSTVTNFRINTYKRETTNCKTQFVVHCINCEPCKMQYVGVTTRSLKDRIREHLYFVNNKKKFTPLYQHFHKCKSNLKFTILDSLEENSNKNILFRKELFWIKLLNCAFPFGLNDNIKNYGNIPSINNPFDYKTDHPFYSLRIVKERKHRGNEKRNKNKTSLMSIILCNTLITIVKIYK